MPDHGLKGGKPNLSFKAAMRANSYRPRLAAVDAPPLLVTAFLAVVGFYHEVMIFEKFNELYVGAI